MGVELSYPSRYHLWSELSRGQTDRLFVPVELASQELHIGQIVALKLLLPDLVLPISLNAMVVGRRHASRRFSEGVYLRLPEKEIEKCRRLLGLSGSPSADHGRRSRRIPAELPIRYTSPASDVACITRNVSASGALCATPVQLTDGQHVEVVLTLDDGTDIAARAEVAWASRQSLLAGLHFIEMTAADRRRLAESLERLRQRIEASRPPGGSIVVADDETEILGFIGKALERAGYSVQKASAGDEALGLVRELQPDLVVLDILMPGIDGMDICKAMRADEEMADIPVVFLSALDPTDLHRVADEAGASDYLAKPVNLNELINLVGAYLKERRPLAPSSETG